MINGVLFLSKNFENYTQPIILVVILIVLFICGLCYFGEDFIDMLSEIDIDFD